MKSRICLFWFVSAMLISNVNAQTQPELPPPLLGQLLGFAQNVYFNANQIAEMPQMPTERAATQPEILAVVASALRSQQHPCTSVLNANYIDDSGNLLSINCVDGNYVVDAQRGKINP
ncbi:hypothetical protein [Acinetobacter sp.]|jgi:hypothetical protein|uniref:hypothetical protein n=1 Tax=Acinetobacter sp. TaxID=472 RepID=UPI00281D9515|nr:hypothetical protein [Acinetobacter sp.]MDR2249673.1 hypothetical protein [Acinetobacter sp.]